jgi:hypothetical protein
VIEVIQGADEKGMTPYNFAVKNALKELHKKIKRNTRRINKLNERY